MLIIFRESMIKLSDIVAVLQLLRILSTMNDAILPKKIKLGIINL